MAGIIAKKLFKESLENRFGKEDPYFETIPATRLGGKPKRRRKANPPGLSDHDGKILTKVKRRAYRLDMCLFNCCGVRFGWSSVIGIIPAIGDVLDMLMAMMVFRTCNEVEGGLPSAVRARMVFNIVVDFFVGLVPILGDVADAVFRANTRNAALLEQHLREKGKKHLRASGAPLPAVDPSDGDEFDRMQATEAPDHTSSQPPIGDQMTMSRPEHARVKDSHHRSGNHISTAGSKAKGSSRGRNDLRDMEEGFASRHPGHTSRKEAAGRSKNGQSSRRGR